MLLRLGLLPSTLVSALLASAPSTQAPFAPPGSGVRPGASSPGGAPASASAEALWADVRRFALSPDETRIVYLADAETDELEELYSIKTTGGAPLKLNAPFPAGRRGVAAFALTPDGRRVVFQADDQVHARYQLSSRSVDGGPTVTIELSERPIAFAIAPDGKRVVFTREVSERSELRIASLESGSSVRVSSSRSVSRFRVTPDGSRVVFGETASLVDRSRHVLLSAPLERPSEVVPLTGFVRNFDFVLSADSERVLFIEEAGPALYDLHSAPVDGSEPAVRVTQLPAEAVLSEWRASPDGGLALYTVGRDPAVAGTNVYASPIEGGGPAVRLNDEPGMFTWRVSPSGLVAYMDRPTTAPVDLLVAPPDGGADTLLAGAARELIGFTPDGAAALYVADGPAGLDDLRTVALDGLAASRLVAALPQSTSIPDRGFPLDAGFAFDVPNGRLVYRLSGPGMLGGLFSAPLDGASPAVDLSKLPFGAVQQFAVAPSLDRVFFAGTALTPGVVELFAVPVDGSSLPKVLVDL